MMPEMDGFEFLERLRDDAKLRDVPVVVLTAKELTDEERAFLAERTHADPEQERPADRQPGRRAVGHGEAAPDADARGRTSPQPCRG